MSTLVKLCGFTQPEDVQEAVAAGADYIGLVFVPSARCVSLYRAARLVRAADDAGFTGRVVGVFADADLREVERAVQTCRLAVVQLHGAESGGYARAISSLCEVWKAVRVRPGWTTATLDDAISDYQRMPLLLDAFVPGVPGGTGVAFEHSLAAPLARQRQVILAGGLTPDTVAAAIVAVQPYGVDVCSGIESSTGEKDHSLLRAFVQAVRSARPTPIADAAAPAEAD